MSPIAYKYNAGQHKNSGRSAVEDALRLRKSRDMAQALVDDLRKRIIDTSTEPWDALESAIQGLRKAQAKVTKKENTLGVDAKHKLRTLLNSPFLAKKMNACALKIRIRERLRSRKFELDRLERSYRKQRSGKLFNMKHDLSHLDIEQRINEHTQDSVKRRDPGITQLAYKYNKLCDDMKTLICQKKAPRYSTSPLKIEMERLFDLDVDDDIWLDVGIGYDDEEHGIVPPLWLSNDNVRAGIRAVMDMDRCSEERQRLLRERSALQLWFNEEWQVVNRALNQGRFQCSIVSYFFIHFTSLGMGRDLDYQLNLRKDKLCRLYVAWESTLTGIPFADGLPEWGPTADEIMQYRARYVLGGGAEMTEEGGFDYDVDFEADADGLLIEHLESLRISENYRDFHNSQ